MFHVKHVSRQTEKIVTQTSVWGCEVSAEHASLLIEYADMLSSYEEANIIGTRDQDELINEHILDSLSCALFRPLKNAHKIVDVGSGGGLPGIPIGISFRGIHVSLVEATAKKAKFLQSVAHRIGIENLTVVNERAEEVGRSVAHRENYDIATARALAPLDVLAEYCLPLVRVGGHVLAMKGRVEKEEIESGRVAAEYLGAEISDIIKVHRLPEYEQKQRHLVVFEKVRQTSAKYPRRVGIPAKKPLGSLRNE